MANTAHEPTETTRRLVQALIAHGATKAEAAREIGVSIPTMDKYYRDEVDTSYQKANRRLAQTLYDTATKPPVLRDRNGQIVYDEPGVPALDYNSHTYVSAMIFASKVRLRLSEVHDININTGQAAGDAAREQLARAIDRLAAAAGAGESAQGADI